MQSLQNTQLTEQSIRENLKVYLFGYAKEVTEDGSARLLGGRESHGFFNGCEVVVDSWWTSYGCTTVIVRDEYTARMQDENVRRWEAHLGQLKHIGM